MPLLAACWTPPCTAYETDFHYGMTYWLSRMAGLDDAESRHVAIGNENRDQGMLDAKYAVIARLCLLRQENASNYTHEAHFRAQKAPPAPRPDRTVVHTASFAGQGVGNVLPTRARRSGTSSTDSATPCMVGKTRFRMRACLRGFGRAPERTCGRIRPFRPSRVSRATLTRTSRTYDPSCVSKPPRPPTPSSRGSWLTVGLSSSHRAGAP